MTRVISLCALLLSTLVVPSEAQRVATDRTGVALAVANALRNDLPSGRIHIVATPGMADVSALLARRFGGKVIAKPDDVITCPRGPASCEIANAVGLMEVRAPWISGSVAKVAAAVWKQEPGRRQAVSYRSVLLHLSRTGGGWVVTKVEDRTMT